MASSSHHTHWSARVRELIQAVTGAKVFPLVRRRALFHSAQRLEQRLRSTPRRLSDFPVVVAPAAAKKTQLMFLRLLVGKRVAFVHDFVSRKSAFFASRGC